MDERSPLQGSAPPASPLYRVNQFSGSNATAAFASRAAALGILHEEALYDDAEDSLIIKTSHDVDTIIRRNRELQTGLFGDMYTPSRDMRWVASIPLGVVMQWMEEGVDVYKNEHWPEVQRRLNDPNWLHLRTGLGRI